VFYLLNISMYRIIDLQGSMMSDEDDVFNSLWGIVKRLTGFHDIDFEWEDDNWKTWDTLQDYLDEIYSDPLDQLLWLCDYGSREIESDDTIFVSCPNKWHIFEVRKNLEWDEYTCPVCWDTDDKCHFPDLFY